MKNILLITTLIMFSFISKAQTVTDIDGNIYNEVSIGNQIWMKENLRVLRYNNGDTIATTIPSTKNIMSEANPKYQWAVHDNLSQVPTFGRTYTWYVVNDDRLLCPTGWRVPNDSDFIELRDFLGGASIAGAALKDTINWNSPNTGATNSTGFSALPCDHRDPDGVFYAHPGRWGLFWSSSSAGEIASTHWGLGYDQTNFTNVAIDNKYGNAVRCIKNSSSTSIKPLSTEELFFFPNPAEGKIYLNNYNSKITISICNLQGKIVLYETLNSNVLDISQLQSGIYIVKLMNSNNVYINKLIKK